MAAQGNFVSITGNLTNDPELRYTNSGLGVVNTAIGYRPYRKDGEEVETSFFDITLWGQLAENAAESFTKGDRVTVTGTLKQERWENNDGEKRSKVVITADTFGPDIRFDTVAVGGSADGSDTFNMRNDSEPF